MPDDNEHPSDQPAACVLDRPVGRGFWWGFRDGLGFGALWRRLRAESAAKREIDELFNSLDRSISHVGELVVKTERLVALLRKSHGALSGEFGGHDACAELIAEIEHVLGDDSPKAMEQGPWLASIDGRTLQSADFHYDVQLRISGDFGGDDERKKYAEELARRLNYAPNVISTTPK